jgi:hypothetical protein
VTQTDWLVMLLFVSASSITWVSSFLFSPEIRRHSKYGTSEECAGYGQELIHLTSPWKPLQHHASSIPTRGAAEEAAGTLAHSSHCDT